MTTSTDDLIEILWVLLTIQGAVALVSTLEAGVATLGFGPGVLPVAVLSALGAAATLVIAAGIVRRSARAVRWARRAQRAWLMIAAVDLALAIIITQQGLELTPTLVRIVVPIAILWILRRPDVLTQFGLERRRSRGERGRTGPGERLKTPAGVAS